MLIAISNAVSLLLQDVVDLQVLHILLVLIDCFYWQFGIFTYLIDSVAFACIDYLLDIPHFLYVLFKVAQILEVLLRLLDIGDVLVVLLLVLFSFGKVSFDLLLWLCNNDFLLLL